MPAVTTEEARAGPERLIEPNGDLIGIQLAHGRPRKGSGRSVRIGQEAREVERLRGKTITGNHIARKRLSRQRIVDGPRGAAEIPPAHGCGWHRVVEYEALTLAHALVAREEEGAFAQDRAAECPAELLPLQLLGLGREEVPRIEDVVSHEVEERHVQLIRPRLRGRVQSAARLAELRGVRALLHLELLQRVDRRLNE